jgi:hypothetical protein
LRPAQAKNLVRTYFNRKKKALCDGVPVIPVTVGSVKYDVVQTGLGKK